MKNITEVPPSSSSPPYVFERVEPIELRCGICNILQGFTVIDDECYYCGVCNIVFNDGCIQCGDENRWMEVIRGYEYKGIKYEGMPQFDNRRECEEIFNDITNIEWGCMCGDCEVCDCYGCNPSPDSDQLVYSKDMCAISITLGKKRYRLTYPCCKFEKKVYTYP